MRTLKAQLCVTGPSLHNRASALASLLYKAVCLSFRPSDRHVHISAMPASIEMGFARYESCVFWNHVYLYKYSSAIR